MNFTSDQICTLSERYKTLKLAVEKFFPALWPQLHACLSSIASLCWNDFPLPVTMIICGPSGSGKTEPLTWIMRSGLDLFVRVDAFTPKSFVTHASNVKKEQLEKIDLLPKLKDRCLITKELAPLFSGRDDEMKNAFAQLTSILDGEGFVSSSGTQGTRGYSEHILFCWLGATTPPSNKVFALMAALGTRLFFFSTDSERPSAKDYARLISGKRSQQDGKEICQKEVSDYLSNFFEKFPIRSIPIDSITISEEISESIGLLCETLTRLRGNVSVGEGNVSEEDRYGAPAMEHGWRAAQVLSALAKGSALIRGNTDVDGEDLAFVRHVTLSSMPEYRRLTFEAILVNSGNVTALEVARHSGMAKKTALHYLKELSVLGVGDLDSDVEPHKFYLSDVLCGLLDKKTDTPPRSVTPKEGQIQSNELDLNNRNDSAQGVTQNDVVCEYKSGEVIHDF